MKRNDEVKLQESIKELIQATVLKYYIPPKKPTRGEEDSERGTQPGAGAIRDIVSRGGPLSEGKKSVGFSTGGDFNKSATKENSKQ